jgi:transposase
LQVVIALVVTPDGFPLAYELMDGNTSERKTLRLFLDHIEKTYGQARRVWVMDRGIPTEATLREMREAGRETFYRWARPRGEATNMRSSGWTCRGSKCATRCR